MKKVAYALAGALAAGVIGSVLAPTATAAAGMANQDTVFVTLCESNGIYNAEGPAVEARVGETIANDLANGIDPVVERNNIYAITNRTITMRDANVMVNAAGVAYLGWALTPSGPTA
jgi:hypothetical protein